MRRLFLTAFLLLLCQMFSAGECRSVQAQGIDVWVDFTSDFHDGNDGAPNGIADWIDELNQATSSSGGVTNGPPSQSQFTSFDRQEIQNNILTDLEQIYDGYNLNFVTVQPLGAHDVIYLGADNNATGIGGGLFGRASGDLGNLQTRTYPTNPDGDPGGVSRVYTGNFNGALEPAFNTRQESIDEISTSLAGTAAHELGHSFGLFHQNVYSADGISSESINTSGQQNQHLLSTGSTGVNESERESGRTLSPFSRVILDIAGGSQSSGGMALVNNPVLSDISEANGGDAGDTLGTATQLVFSLGESSGAEISFIEADLDNTESDVDVYHFNTTVETTLTSHVFTSRTPGFSNFDSVLELVDATGTVVGLSDDIGWRGDEFGDISNSVDDDTGSFLVNLTVDPGDYFLRVSTATTDIDAAANVGDSYWLVTSLVREAAAVPEPSSILLLTVAAMGTPLLRRRKSNS